ncbi:acyl carrier protein [Actinacidiphila bryophytorum]|uniref:Acyl carrier protein n=1 Tax=Actinacidiphila bryophytorum TaxID=1436133 RepID=A0A9W4MF73_9ACTN|nr:acyl carrier protein [Actinacidiphila bryophytorum]MBM9434923.1 acyl carrier protein [Actinacidiphila bryophytorum]MBN6547938.1 acyl carrier protein [Actinacidiphila bryophytorum]CAG7641370.1 Acyl carrier protein [Actinacidiphila bryophytorum]
MSEADAPGAGPGREEIVAILAAFGDRPPEEVPEGIDSMELAWLVHQIEERYGDSVDDAAMSRMTTVSTALDVLAELRSGRHSPGGPAA